MLITISAEGINTAITGALSKSSNLHLFKLIISKLPLIGKAGSAAMISI